MPDKHSLTRTTFTTSRLLDFFSEKELIAQTGHALSEWPLVIAKEAIDNALDACEEAGIAPVINVVVNSSGITVTDNGPGIPEKTVASILDYAVRVSSRAAYVSPTRGAQGNALKTLIAMPFVLGGTAPVVIEGQGVRHEITIAVDQIAQKPVVAPLSFPSVTTTSSVHIPWPERVGALLTDCKTQFTWLINRYVWFNPHLAFTFDWFGDAEENVEALSPTWAKWKPSDPTSPHWYDKDRFIALIAAYIAADRQSGRERSVRDFVREFRGLSSTVKASEIVAALGAARLTLEQAFVKSDDIDEELAVRLLILMRSASNPVKPKQLGVIGQDYLHTCLEIWGCFDSLRYKRIEGEDDGVPFVVEVGFGTRIDGTGGLILGVNWSPAIRSPFRSLGHGQISLDGLLVQNWVRKDEPALVAVHVAYARASYADRGKSTVTLPLVIGDAVIEAVETVTRPWKKLREREERRQLSAEQRLQAAEVRAAKAGTAERMTIKDAAWLVMEEAYDRASDGGTLPAAARQVMYAARRRILELTGMTSLNDAYFTQTLLPDFMAANPELTADWDVTFNARGSLREPHTYREVPLGTIDVRDYLDGIERFTVPAAGVVTLATEYPTTGPENRYGAVLFIEKEGFDPLFRSVQLAERFDIAVMSTKGLSNVASRRLVDTVGNMGVPIFVLHDFDKSGFSIVGTLRRETRRYTFENEIEVIDLGLRLSDIAGLEREPVSYSGMTFAAVAENLRLNGATEEEIEVLETHRVELNAMTSRQLVDFIEARLTEHGVNKLMPAADSLADAFRRATITHDLQRQLDALAEEARAGAEAITVPDDIEQRVRDALAADPTLSWDAALTGIIRGALGAGTNSGKAPRSD